MSQFRSVLMSQRWTKLHQERQELMSGKITSKIEDKIDLISSLMTSCKLGFLLSDAKIKKSIKFLKTHTNKDRVRYGTLPAGDKNKTLLFKDIVLMYVERGDTIIFREHIEEK